MQPDGCVVVVTHFGIFLQVFFFSLPYMSIVLAVAIMPSGTSKAQF